MRTTHSKFVLGMGALALVFAVAPGALAQCGLPTRSAKPSAWQPRYGSAQQDFVRAGFDNDDEHGPSIVGMWHVIFTAQTMNDAPFSGVIDNALVVVHSDGTEIMNSARPAQDGSFCLGVWARTGRLGYFINHLPWQGNDTENAPSGIGNPTGGSQITEKIELSPNGNSYSGTFKLVAYDTSGHITVSFTGVLTAKRVTPSTSFSDLL